MMGYYFTEETENAIVEYNNTEDAELRSEIFRKKLEFPLNKLVENIIHTFKFSYFDLPLERVQKDVVTFITTKLDKYDKNKGKAFSYFGTAAKNYLILQNNKNYKDYNIFKSIDYVSYEENEINTEEINHLIDNSIKKEEEQNDLKEIIHRLSLFLDNNIEEMFPKSKDQNIAHGINQILKDYESVVEYFYKKTLHILIKEYSGESNYNIAKVINKIKEYYKKECRKYYDEKFEKNKWNIYTPY